MTKKEKREIIYKAAADIDKNIGRIYSCCNSLAYRSRYAFAYECPLVNEFMSFYHMPIGRWWRDFTPEEQHERIMCLLFFAEVLEI